MSGNTTVTGNVVAGYLYGDGSNISGIASNLDQITNNGNVTSNTVQFSNAITGLVTTANVEVGGELTVTGNVVAGYLYGDGSNISGIASNLDQIVNNGNVTSNTVQFSNAITGLITTANVEVGGELTVSGNLTVLGTTTTLDVDNFRVQDPIIELGKDNTVSPLVDLGLVMTRPSGSSNVGIIFDESTDILEIGYTEDSASDSTITMQTAAVNPISVNVNGTVSGTSITDGTGTLSGGAW